jgi:hypothetical protein
MHLKNNKLLKFQFESDLHSLSSIISSNKLQSSIFKLREPCQGSPVICEVGNISVHVEKKPGVIERKKVDS